MFPAKKLDSLVKNRNKRLDNVMNEIQKSKKKKVSPKEKKK